MRAASDAETRSEVDGEEVLVSQEEHRGERREIELSNFPNWKCLRVQNNEKAIIIEIINQKFQFQSWKFEL